MGMVALAGQSDPTIREAARETDIECARTQRTHHAVLHTLAVSAGAEHAFATNQAGRITADWDFKGISPIGQDMSFRTYFKKAMQGTENIYGAKRLSTGRRTYYVAARYPASELDEFLTQGQYRIGLVVSPIKVVFAASRSDWIMRAMLDSDDEQIRAVNASKQFQVATGEEGEFLRLPFSLNADTVQVDSKSRQGLPVRLSHSTASTKRRLSLASSPHHWPCRAAVVGRVPTGHPASIFRIILTPLKSQDMTRFASL